MKKDFRTPLVKSLGLGSAHSGTKHYMRQIALGLVNIPLMLLFVFLLLCLLRHGYHDARAIIARPFISCFFITMLVCSIYHMKLGMQVIIEDYIPNIGIRTFVLGVNNFVCLVLAILSILSILKIALGG